MAAATRAFAENGLGLSIEHATKELEQIKRLWLLLPEAPLFEEWERLAKTYRVSGKNTYDARLVAAMDGSGIDKIPTFNARDFARYEGITVLDPANLA